MNTAKHSGTNWHLRRRQSQRGAFLYVAVLFTTLIVMISVSAALTISTANLRGETDRTDQGEALRLAESEIHRQAAILRTSSQWRSTAINDVFSDWHSLTTDGSAGGNQNSQVRHRFHDSDGQLDDDPTDGVELTVHARVGNSAAAITVFLESDPKPLDLLRYSVTAADDIHFDLGGTISCERPVQVLDDCRTSTSGILTTPQLECSGSVQMTLRGDLAASAVSLPGNDVVATYIALGTEIPLVSIPQTGGGLLIEDRLLSKTLNPFGAVDAAGIYWLDAAGNKVIISHCRFDATLAIRNASEIEIRGGINWNYPTSPDVILATDAPITMTGVEGILDEADRDINFNPASSPYRESLSNSTNEDTYPCELRGVVYSSNDFTLDPLVNDEQLRLCGSLIAYDLRIEGYMAVTQLNELLNNPPAGLSDPTPMRFVRGSFRRIPSP